MQGVVHGEPRQCILTTRWFFTLKIEPILWFSHFYSTKECIVGELKLFRNEVDTFLNHDLRKYFLRNDIVLYLLCVGGDVGHKCIYRIHGLFMLRVGARILMF